MDRISVEDIRKRVAAFPYWYHTMELAPGVKTPGAQNSGLTIQTLDALGLPRDCKGKRVLDLGARDGFFSFEMERRGAEVVAIDYANPSATGFGIAAEIIGSKVPFTVDNVYSLTSEKYGLFDIVFFLGLIYHLRNPLLALDTIRPLCGKDCRLYIESAIIRDPLAKISTLLQRLFQLFFGKDRFPDLTTWRILPTGSFNSDGTNCWLPSMEGLRAAVESAEFTMTGYRKIGARGVMAARAVTNSEVSRFRKLDTSVGEYQ